MHILFVFKVLSLMIRINGEEDWKIDSREAEWNSRRMNKAIDKTIIDTTAGAGSLFMCEFICTSLGIPNIGSLYFIKETRKCHCNRQKDPAPESASAQPIYYGEPETYVQNDKSRNSNARSTRWPYLRDCLELYENGFKDDGSYSIKGWDGNLMFAQCDMTNEGWTIIQNRFDGTVNFNRNWEEYRLGFGDIYGEFWIGLENIHHLTVENSSMSMYVEAFPGVEPQNATSFNEYFFVHDNASKFLAETSDDVHECGKGCTAMFNGREFSTPDNDNSYGCARYYQSGWWFLRCMDSNLNGNYFPETEMRNHKQRGIHWYWCWFYATSQKATQMKVRRVLPDP